MFSNGPLEKMYECSFRNISVEYLSQSLLLGYLNRITVTGFLDFPVTIQNSVSQEFEIAFAGGFDKFAIFIILETDYLSI